MKKYINNFIIVFIMGQFLIDLFTSLAVTNNWGNVTVGIILKTLFAIFLVVYTFICSDKKTRKKQILYYTFLGVYAVAFCGLNIYKHGIGTLFVQIKSLIKTFYFPLILVSLLSLERANKLDIKKDVLIYSLVGYTSIILVAKISGTAFWSYPYRNNLGTVGWFYSANEIGNIISMLFPILVMYIMKEKWNNLFLVYLAITIFAMLEIGTKVPFFSLILMAGLTGIICLIKKEKKYYRILLGEAIISLLIILLLGSSSVGKNIKNNYGINIPDIMGMLRQENNNSEVKLPANEEINTEVVLSNRTQFLETNFKRYKESGIINKAIGLGYIEDNEQIKTAEMDFFDILFFNGITGFILYFAPLLVLVIEYVKVYTIKQIINMDIIILLFDFCLVMGIAFFTGHVLTAPSVTTYLATIVLQLDKNLKENKNLKEKNEKEKI